MSKRKNTKAKQLTNRDINILTDLTRCRAVSFDQIKNNYWPAAKERTCKERLQLLEKSGYLTEHTISTEKPGIYMQVYSLNTKGKRWATSSEGLGMNKDIVFIHPGKENEIIHQIRTNQIYFELSKDEKRTWIIGDAIEVGHKSSRSSNSFNSEIPDACFTNNTGESIFVETDCGKYTGKQIREKVSSFAGQKTIWVCPVGREQTLINHGVDGEFNLYNIS